MLTTQIVDARKQKTINAFFKPSVILINIHARIYKDKDFYTGDITVPSSRCNEPVKNYNANPMDVLECSQNV